MTDPSPTEIARRELAREAFAATMAGPVVELEAHRVMPGDGIQCADDKWRPVMASFGENAASASPTLWAIYAYSDWDDAPTQRLAWSPAERIPIRRKAL